ncbi:amidohydrolase family protein [Arenimonas fontis]|uniref:Amidohydrolase family protein n=1 Tax=Arenimonas fontis TaxID=2608255 RepID=A0A5B2Z800_9GAMM|nr:amidohydrolase family protein [Arenimonas fontis]KAA2284017.1 amidohydrolase family protein [Arenimonas fontis]
MKRLFAIAIACACSLAAPAAAQDLLIRGATVHTADAAGTLKDHDVLVRGGVIRAIGRDLPAPAGAAVVEAGGRPLTPGLFAGLSGLGVEEVSGEAATVDGNLALGTLVPPQQAVWRPEFDLDLAFNPASMAIPVSRIEGLSFTVLAPGAVPGGSLLAGQGSAFVLDGSHAPLAGSRSLFINLGSDVSPLSGGSRAGQWMLLEQAVSDARNGSDELLTRAGRAALARYLDGGRVVFHVDRAADIRQTLAFARRHGIRPVIAGGAEAWQVADELRAAGAPVLLDPLLNLPYDFDRLGARLDNAARLHRAGVTVAFSQSGDATHNARKIRQLAGNAVANGLPWEAGLAGLTSAPARIFGIRDRGRIAVGQVADLVLWSGDPLEVTSLAQQMWLAGKPVPMRSRQTELRDRYLVPSGELPRAYVK